jgi:hypothetical protein
MVPKCSATVVRILPASTSPATLSRSACGAAAAVTALTAKAKLAGMWREKVDQHNTGPVYERIERVIVERAPQSAPNGHDEGMTEVVREIGCERSFTEVARDFGMPRRHWSA